MEDYYEEGSTYDWQVFESVEGTGIFSSFLDKCIYGCFDPNLILKFQFLVNGVNMIDSVG